GYEYGSFHFLEPSFLHNYTDSTCLITSASVIVTGTARIVNENHFLFLFFKVVFFDRNTTLREKNNQLK
ncbi:hypothetical protein ABNE23_16880, partial [Paenibacillus larvae]